MFSCRLASAAIREFEGILDDLYKKPPKWDLVTIHRDELQNYREIIKYQDKKLREITERYCSLVCFLCVLSINDL